MARFTFQQYELNLTVFVQIPTLIRRPVFSNQIALNNAGLFGISANVVGFVVAIQRLTRRFFVEETTGTFALPFSITVPAAAGSTS